MADPYSTVASIPIIVLWRSKLKSQQKFIVGPFLCLSLVMIVFAILRISKTHSAKTVDICWLAFWQYLEAGIAIIVTSVTTLRTVFTAQKRSRPLPVTTSRIYNVGKSAGNNKSILNTIVTSSSEESHLMVSGKTLVTDKSLPPSPARSHIFVHESWDVSYSEGDLEQGNGSK